ncbi:putative ester cyclase [Litoreibacter ponti]|uniref:Putative ester cyclase n=1 Tax=Litoreibacter ponti TaxID=1510457 RepID=A0A2T6BHJ9_9RHOB|nr:ester cyclase [Litoreibacter ponti]PTX55532.1 putative ester cyclase [Litoreibacter ponti]
MIHDLCAALYDFEEAPVRAALDAAFAPDAVIHLCHPFGDLTGPALLYDHAFEPLFGAIPDLERRDWIVIEGETAQGGRWIGCGGYYTGLFDAPFLGIPATGRQAHMRFHEFYRIEDARVVEMQAIWDIPELMMQAGAWPMAPSLGREWLTPSPATQDGLGPHSEDGAANLVVVQDMLIHMGRHPGEGGPEVMEMERFWHPRMSWYGPAGIGTGRGIDGFRRHHQIPFLAAMPDRGNYRDQLDYHFFAQGSYVAVTGWPNMRQHLTHGGWMGIAPSGKQVEMRSLDFWRLENGLIRENWVLVDLLDVYRQLGVDVFARMGELVGGHHGT